MTKFSKHHNTNRNYVTAKEMNTKKEKAAASTLIIVESPTKARTLGKYLKSIKEISPLLTGGNQETKKSISFQVLASGGHIVDLPSKKFGVDIDDGFKPDYEILPGKKKIANEIKRAASNAIAVLIATDPDREGEAIAWHISNLITGNNNSKVWRIQFNEITSNAVREALKSPGNIDKNKVDAQQARRILDRLVGYKVSPLLWKTVTGGLSAGRVQSVALRLICEREAEICDFVKVEYWTHDGMFKGADIDIFKARLHKLDGKKVEVPNGDEAARISGRLKKASYKCSDIKRTQRKRNPYPPYITSTLQQDAGRRFGMPVKMTMGIAQKLYEGIEISDKGSIGLITYMRTDSTRIAKEAIDSVREWIVGAYGADHLSSSLRIFKNKKGAVQDAHEAIRPTDVSLTPDILKPYLSPPELKLYNLIWRRFVASQMKRALIDVTTVTITDGEGIEFRVAGQVVLFPGFLTVFSDHKNDEDENGNGSSKIPHGLVTGMPLDLKEVLEEQHFTQPPPRYSEANLVKELDELGIGRPSTYATIISTLLDRNYVDKREKVLHPTELGNIVSSVLVNQFPKVFNVDFTAKMEEELDRIEMGTEWLKVIEEFYTPFSEALKAAEKNSSELKSELVQQPVGRECPKCGKDLIYRWSKRGRFISCSGYPSCKHAENLNQAEPVEVDQKCPKCGSPMLLREGKYGRFLGCSKYPECRGILPLKTGFKCPKEGCDGDIGEKRSKKGRIFYGCSRYPDCDFVTWDEPVKGSCPDCAAQSLFHKKSKKDGEFHYCSKCGWKDQQ